MSAISARHRRDTLLAALLTVLAGCGLASASESASFQPNDRPVLDVRRASGPIRVDGRLDDPGWESVARAANFVETWPGDNVQPPIEHQAWMTYDDERLYFAVLVRDDPEALRASLRDRDEIWRDDYVGLIFDTYGTGAWAYEIFINPLGVQMDLRWTPEGEDMGFDVVFDSESRITEDGWQVEVAVPFKSLRFPDREVQEWRGTFWHNRPRESRNRYSWSMQDRDNPCWPCTWGTIRGIEDVNSGSALELLPSLTAVDANALADEDDPASEFEDVDTDADLSLGLRYAINSSYAAEGTFNPDFSQVESDAAQIDANTTFALFFPERRPFFQEGSDLYSSWVNAIYTRSINDPQWAAKLTGRTRNSSVAYLSAQDELSPLILPFEERSEILSTGRSWSNVVRARRNLHGDSHVGGLFTDRRLEGGGSGTTFGADTMLRFRENYQLEAQLLFSHTEEPVDAGLSEDVDPLTFGEGYTAALDGESFWGHASYLSLERHARRWSWDLDYWRTSETFRADNGFITQNDNQRAAVSTHLSWQPDNWLLDDFTPFLQVARVWNMDGQRKDEWIRPQLNFQFKGQTHLSAGWLTSNELFGGVQMDGIQRWSVRTETRFTDWIDGGLFYEVGDFPARNEEPVVLGEGSRFSLWGNLQPVSRLAIEPSLDFAELEDPGSGQRLFDGFIARTRISLQLNRELFLRLVLQYDDFEGIRDVEPLVSYKLNPFTVFYLGSAHRLQHFGQDEGILDTDLEQTDRQYFVKLQYLFRS